MSAVSHHDLSAAPLRPSRVLTAFVADRQAQRRRDEAERQRRTEMGEFRRIAGGSAPRRSAIAAAAAPGPAFASVSGQRAFQAAGTDRLTAGWLSSSTGINADLEGSLATLRARSRDWCMNTDMGERWLALVGDNIVGSEPPRLQVRATLADGTMDEAANAAIESAWADWCRRAHCDITGEQSFGEMLRTIIEGTARDGEHLVRRIRDRRLPYGYALQLLDVDRIDTAHNLSPAPGRNAVRLGVEIDNLGRRQALWLMDYHPGDSGAGYAPTGARGRVVVDDLLHGFVRRRAEQLRGYPWCAASLKGANELQQYKQFAMTAARVGAAKMGFYTVDKDVVTDGMALDELRDATGQLVQDVEAGMLEALPPGVDFKSFDPDYPHQNYSAFLGHHQRDLASGLNVAHHNLTGDMAGVNYSSARIAELAERRHWRALQRWLINAVVRPVFEDWLRMALLTGNISLPSGAVLPGDRFEKFAAAAAFQPPGWAWVDPEADIKASATAITYDLRSLRQISDEQGVDLDDVLADKQRLMQQYKAAGLPVPPWMSGGIAAAAPGAPPAPSPAPAAANGATA